MVLMKVQGVVNILTVWLCSQIRIIFVGAFIAILLACAPGSRSVVEPSTIVVIASPVVQGDNAVVVKETLESTSTSEPDPDNRTIYGSVLDLSTNRPGVGVAVLVNDAVVRTDPQGNYTLSGLPAGAYTIRPKLEGQSGQAHEPILVRLEGQQQVEVKLAYYSQPRPIPTDTPQPQALALTMPSETLPDSGAALEYQPWLWIGAGLLLIVIGCWRLNVVK